MTRTATEARRAFAECMRTLPAAFSGVVALHQGTEELAVHCAGFANLAEGLPNTPTTRFGIASGSKVFTAIAVLQLVERGRLELDTRLEEVLHGHRVDPGITIRHLLTNRSGLPDYFDETASTAYQDLWREIPSYSMRRPEDFFPLFLGRPNAFPPGSRFAYCNSGYVVLARVVELLAGGEFPDCIRAGILEPGGLRRTGYDRLDALPRDTALGYLPDGAGGFRTNVFALPVIGGGDGGAFSCAGDVAAFWRGLLANRFLGPALTAEVLRVQSESPEGDRYGMGVWLSRSLPQVVLLEGSDPGVGFVSYHHTVTGRTLTVFTNTGAKLGPALGELARLVEP
jgi:CubicO group peptidase (beta-lactamase class C family)